MSSQQTNNQFDELPIQQKFPNIIDFFQQYTAYDLMPTSARVLTIDADTSVHRALRIMGDNATSSAYIYDPKTAAVITATDIMKACIIIQNTFFSREATHDPVEFARRNNIVFENQIGVQDLLQHISIGSITQQQNLIKTYTTTTLYQAISVMVDKNVHRLPVIDHDGSILLQLTYRQICCFLVSKFRFNTNILQKPILETGIANTNFCTVNVDSSVLDTINTIVNNRLSVVPVLDKDGKLRDVFSKYDFQNMGDSGIIDLNQKVIDAIQKRPHHIEGCVTMPISCTIGQLLRQIADKNLHRMMLVDDQNKEKLTAVVSLRHVLKYLTNADIYEEDQVDNYQYITGSKYNSLPQDDLQSSSMKEIELTDEDQDWRLFQRQNADEQF
ncbi:5'-AMP-activated_protein kinase [Hexamita inflata]|uniref:Gamma-1 subunit n=1 Tax=Hexamita inflata TaxID=28002 RepID=A0AA86P9T2_9EUKA|nr:5'-AMP-activated protein kinase [Hexamita inflata]